MTETRSDQSVPFGHNVSIVAQCRGSIFMVSVIGLFCPYLIIYRPPWYCCDVRDLNKQHILFEVTLCTRLHNITKLQLVYEGNYMRCRYRLVRRPLFSSFTGKWNNLFTILPTIIRTVSPGYYALGVPVTHWAELSGIPPRCDIVYNTQGTKIPAVNGIAAFYWLNGMTAPPTCFNLPIVKLLSLNQWSATTQAKHTITYTWRIVFINPT